MNFPIESFSTLRTPFYYYDLNLLRQTLDALCASADYPGFKVHYALKANNDPEVLKTIASYGLGADTVSGGEILNAINAGFSPEGILLAGVGKSDKELLLAMTLPIGCINVESTEELQLISELATANGLTAKVCLRVNPDIDAHTHEYITTGLAENKFGISMPSLEKAISMAMSLPGIQFEGLHFHIGSQITVSEPYRLLCERINALQDEYNAKGISFNRINVGGGLGIDYDNPDANPIPDFKTYFDTFRNHLQLRPGQTLHFELGRAVVAQMGSLITRVRFVKRGDTKSFVIIDAGMTDLIRPALYGAHHKIENLTPSTANDGLYDVVGPICESSDCFGKNEWLPITKRGDIYALRSAGAYGQVMASQYNARPLPPTVTSSEAPESAGAQA